MIALPAIVKRKSTKASPAALMRNTGILQRVGNTPLLPIHGIPLMEGVSPLVVIFAKAEWFNPGGSVKARPALSFRNIFVSSSAT